MACINPVYINWEIKANPTVHEWEVPVNVTALFQSLSLSSTLAGSFTTS